jgi:hypothetical protein
MSLRTMAAPILDTARPKGIGRHARLNNCMTNTCRKNPIFDFTNDEGHFRRTIGKKRLRAPERAKPLPTTAKP